MQPKLSVCIPTYNRKEQVLKQLAGIARSGQDNLARVEVLVSDNSSDPRYHLMPGDLGVIAMPVSYWVNGGNIGYAGNLRKLVAASRGEYVWFLSDDDFLYEGAVATLLAALDAESRTNYLTFDHDISFDGAITVRNRWFAAEDHGFHESGDEFLGRHINSVCFVSINIFRRSLLVELVRELEERGMTNATHENMLMAVALIGRHGGCYCVAESLMCESGGEKVWSYETSCQGPLDVMTLYVQMHAFLPRNSAALRAWSERLDSIMTISTELMLFETAYTRPDFDFRPVFDKLLALPFEDAALRRKVRWLRIFYRVFRNHPLVLKLCYYARRRRGKWRYLHNWARDLDRKREAGGYISAY